MQNLQADNQRILQEARERDNMLKEAREMKEKWLLMLKMKRKFKD
jgi:F-type H+-transporting ATPase subunit b